MQYEIVVTGSVAEHASIKRIKKQLNANDIYIAEVLSEYERVELPLGRATDFNTNKFLISFAKTEEFAIFNVIKQLNEFFDVEISYDDIEELECDDPPKYKDYWVITNEMGENNNSWDPLRMQDVVDYINQFGIVLQIGEAERSVKLTDVVDHIGSKEIDYLLKYASGVITNSPDIVELTAALDKEKTCIFFTSGDKEYTQFPNHITVSNKCDCINECNNKEESETGFMIPQCMKKISSDSIIQHIDPELNKKIIEEKVVDLPAAQQHIVYVKETLPQPMIFTAHNHCMWFGNMYKGGSAFLVCAGKSIIDQNLDLDRLKQPGILSMGVNNVPKIFRPNIWACVDNTTHFILSIWRDPTIMKFVPYPRRFDKVFDSIKWKEIDENPAQNPNTWFYHVNERFDASNFLIEDSFNWGASKENGGGRTVMLAAIKMLYYLGIRNIYLVGCDFKMTETESYAFEQNRSKNSIRGNNTLYYKTNKRLNELRPLFEQNGLNIYNCNPESGLNAFPFVSYDDAIEACLKTIPDISQEKTDGLYNRISDEKKRRKREAKYK